MSTSTDQSDVVVARTTTQADPQLAFEVFTAGIQTWWNPGHHVLPGTLKTMTVEPFVGGRLWDENTDGDTCTWGRVLVWEPGQAFVFSWLVGTDWAVPGPDAPGSRVTVTFTPTADGGTHVELVHDQLAIHGPGWEGLKAGVSNPEGWPGELLSFAAAADTRAAS